MNSYQPIFNTNLRATFEDYVSSLNIPGIDYFAIGMQDTINLNSTSLISRIEWQKTFSAMHFAKHDPVRIAALNSKRKVFCFDDIDYLDSLGNEIMRQRTRYGISNGIVIMDRRVSHNYMLTLATDYSKFSGHDFFIQHHSDLKRIFADFIALIQPATAEIKKQIR